MTPKPPTPTAEHGAAVARPSRRWLRRLGIGALATFALVLALGLVAWLWGGPMPAPAASRAAYAQAQSAGQVPPLQDRFVVPIPGCVCHSKDPYLQTVHAERRIRECSGCHSGGAPVQ